MQVFSSKWSKAQEGLCKIVIQGGEEIRDRGKNTSAQSWVKQMQIWRSSWGIYSGGWDGLQEWCWTLAKVVCHHEERSLVGAGPFCLESEQKPVKKAD